MITPAFSIIYFLTLSTRSLNSRIHPSIHPVHLCRNNLISPQSPPLHFTSLHSPYRTAPYLTCPALPSPNSGLCVDRLLLTGKRKKTRFFTWEEVYVCGRYVCTTLHTSLKWLWISFLAFTMTSLFTWWLVLLTIWEIWYCTAEHIAYITSIVLPWSFWLWGLHSLSLSLLLFL